MRGSRRSFPREELIRPGALLRGRLATVVATGRQLQVCLEHPPAPQAISGSRRASCGGPPSAIAAILGCAVDGCRAPPERPTVRVTAATSSFTLKIVRMPEVRARSGPLAEPLSRPRSLENGPPAARSRPVLVPHWLCKDPGEMSRPLLTWDSAGGFSRRDAIDVSGTLRSAPQPSKRKPWGRRALVPPPGYSRHGAAVRAEPCQIDVRFRNAPIPLPLRIPIPIALSVALPR